MGLSGSPNGALVSGHRWHNNNEEVDSLNQEEDSKILIGSEPFCNVITCTKQWMLKYYRNDAKIHQDKDSLKILEYY